jgi:hypothetical protein
MTFVLLHGSLKSPLLADRVVVNSIRSRDQAWFRRYFQEPLGRGDFSLVRAGEGHVRTQSLIRPQRLVQDVGLVCGPRHRLVQGVTKGLRREGPHRFMAGLEVR